MKNSFASKLILGDYMIGETLGKGTFGKVKLGTYLPTKDRMAVKILEKSKMKDNDDFERVVREMQIIQQFNNENVIKVYEILEDKERYYIIMEYCEEGELFNYIVKKKRLTEEEAAFFFYQLINGLESIHNLDIVHRDLKPENLLLNKEKKLKIIDFGLSNFFSLNGNLLSTPCGSPCYASPEMVAGRKYKGFMIDIWSTGIILYAMICGYLPFEDPDNEKLFLKILECNLTFPSYVTPQVKDIIKKILNTDPEKRMTINEIKKHSFYLNGKTIYGKVFQSKTDMASEGSPTTVSSGKSESHTKSSNLRALQTGTHHPSASVGLNFNNFLFSNSLSPKNKENQKYVVTSTLGSTTTKAAKNELLILKDLQFQYTDSNKVTLTNPGRKNVNYFNKNHISTSSNKVKLGAKKKMSSISSQNKYDIGDVYDTVSSLENNNNKITYRTKNINLEFGKRTLNSLKEPVSFYSLDFNMPDSNKFAKSPKNFDFNFTKSKFSSNIKEKYDKKINIKPISKKILPSIKNDTEIKKVRERFDTRHLYIKTDESASLEPQKNYSINIDKKFPSKGNHSTKISNNIKFDKFSGSNNLSNTFNKFKEKMNSLYSKDFFSKVGGVKS
jgi:serine/threonine protein kinase